MYGGASQTMSFLLNDEALRWVLPPTVKDSESDMMEFRPTDFVASTRYAVLPVAGGPWQRVPDRDSTDCRGR